MRKLLFLYNSNHDLSCLSSIVVCVVVLFMKLFWFFFDPSPQFFLGDSQSYITTAIHGWIPPDRSFFYGYIIRYLTMVSHSLTSLVFAQVLASFVSCMTLAYLLRLMNLPNYLVIAGTLLFAIEPLQLFYERYVMAETFGLMFFAFFLCSWAIFLKKQDYKWIVLGNILGVFVVSLRLSFLPIIQIAAVACPVIPFVIGAKMAGFRNSHKMKKMLVGLSISLVCFFLMHSGYKYLNGSLSKSNPAYNYESGFFLLASWSPLVIEEDFEDKSLASIIVPPTYRELSLRESNRWAVDGIVTRLVKTQPDKATSEKIAAQIAKKIFLRDPIGVIRLGLTTFAQLWDRNSVFWAMKYDRGEKKLPDTMLADLSENYNLDGKKIPFLSTLSVEYFFSMRLWYRVLLISPAILLVAFFAGRPTVRSLMLLLFIATSIVVLISTMVSTMPVVRYLHPLGWMVIPGILVLVEKLTFKVFGNKRLNDANQERIS